MGVGLWAVFLALQQTRADEFWLYDWHVYSAGANHLLDRTLYYSALESAFPLPIPNFNYPPLAALAAVPFLALPDQLAGTIWVTANVAAMGATGVLVAKLLGLHHAALWGGLAFAAYTVHPWFSAALQGNNNPLVLLVLTGFALAHQSGRQRRAGILLGVAICVKLWPVTLLPLLLRDRRPVSLWWAISIVTAVIIAAAVWLGPEVAQPALAAMLVRADIAPGNPVLGLTWVRETFDWWPAWGGLAVAAALLAIPATGRFGLGLGVLAGMAAVPNLWRHYLATSVLGLLLTVVGFVEHRRARNRGESATPITT